MTSNTEPEGEVSVSSILDSTVRAYSVFSTGFWHSAAGSTQWIRYKFIKPMCVKRVFIKNDSTDAGGSKVTYIQASNDGNNWINLTDAFDCGGIGNITNININNTNYYVYYRLYSTDSNYISGGNKYLVVNKLQFYGRSQQ